MPRGVKFQPPDPQAVVDGYRDGMTGPELAARHGTSRDSIYRFLRSEAQTLRTGFRRAPVDTEEIVRMHRDGWTPTEMSQIFNCSRGTINKRLARAGLTSAPKAPPAEGRKAPGGTSG